MSEHPRSANNVVQTAAKTRLPKNLESRRPLEAEEAIRFFQHLDWTTIAPPVAALAILRQPEVAALCLSNTTDHVEEGLLYFGEGPPFESPVDVAEFWETVLWGVKQNASYASMVKEWHLMATTLTKHILTRIKAEPETEQC